LKEKDHGASTIIEELFSQQFVTKELARYRSKGPDKTTRMLTEAIEAEGVEGFSLLDIGGGLGAIQHELLDSGIQNVTSVEASTAYLNAARAEVHRADMEWHFPGNCRSGNIAPADLDSTGDLLYPIWRLVDPARPANQAQVPAMWWTSG
jgi:hypothetical protein